MRAAWKWDKTEPMTDKDGVEHQPVGFAGCLCGWQPTALGAWRELDKHISKAMSP